jgi:hypothetical protein
MPARIISPPMVGVPTLDRCETGPSARIGWPLPCLSRIQSMKRLPMVTATIMAVAMASATRTVWYWTRLSSG